MKRKGNLYQQVYSIKNLLLADKRARKGKQNQYGVIQHDKSKSCDLLLLHNLLADKTYRTSEYKKFLIYEPKEREIFKLPYFPDRICHHAIMNVLEPIFVSVFTADTFSCIKGRGIKGALKAVNKALLDKENTKYVLKIDIKKFYPNIDHAILKKLLRRKLKDKDLLWLLDEIIDSAQGVPIGNYLSQYFANFYLTYFDHWLKEKIRVVNYFRYADDMVIFSSNKAYLHKLLAEMRAYLGTELKLEIKGNYQISPVIPQGLDFVGYVSRPTHVMLRPRIKKRFIIAVLKNKSRQSVCSYLGWLKHCNAVNLKRKILYGSKNKEIQRL